MILAFGLVSANKLARNALQEPVTLMTDFRLLVLDVDGTLIGKGAYPTPRVTAAIAAVKARGIGVALSTGRATEACYHLLEHLKLDGLHVVFDEAGILEKLEFGDGRARYEDAERAHHDLGPRRWRASLVLAQLPQFKGRF